MFSCSVQNYGTRKYSHEPTKHRNNGASTLTRKYSHEPTKHQNYGTRKYLLSSHSKPAIHKHIISNVGPTKKENLHLEKKSPCSFSQFPYR